MKTGLITAAAVVFALITGCKRCDCDCDKDRDAAGQNMNGENATGENASDAQDQNAAGQDAGSSSHYRHTGTTSGTGSGSVKGGGVGNADAETGTLDNGSYEVDKPAGTGTQAPHKPGITGTHATTGAGTGTSSGRQIN